MKATNQITSIGGKKEKFSAFLAGGDAQMLIRKATSTPEKAARLTATLLSVYGGSEALKNCDSMSILSAALSAESLNLDISLGQFSIVPFGGTAKGSPSAKGYKQLAIRSCAYDDIAVYDVREGEFKGYDDRTWRPIVKRIADNDVRSTLPIVGYYGFYELNEQYNHFFRCIYWTHDEILRHADRYAKSFDLAQYKKLLAGELDEKEAKKLENGTPWYGAPDSRGHMAMCEKTIYRQLLNDGFAPLSSEMRSAMSMDEAAEQGNDFVPASSAPSRKAERQPEEEFIEIDPDTGEVLENDNTPSKAAKRPVDEKKAGGATAPADNKKVEQRAASELTETMYAKNGYEEETPVYTDEDDPFARFA